MITKVTESLLFTAISVAERLIPVDGWATESSSRGARSPPGAALGIVHGSPVHSSERLGHVSSRLQRPPGRVAVMSLVGLASRATRARVRQSWSTVRKCQPLIHPHRPEYRDPGTAVPACPQASQSDAAIRGRQAVSYTACERSAASDTAPQYARTLTGRRGPAAVLSRNHVLHRGHVLRVRRLQGCQSPLAWCYSLSHAATLKGGGCLLRSSQHAGTGAASREEQSSVTMHHLSKKIYVVVLQKQN